MNLSQRALNITPSATLAVSEKARKLKQEGKEVVVLSAGEPDFDTPEDVKQEATRALKEGLTKYTNTTGVDELKEAIQQKFKQDNQLDFSFSQIAACAGAKQAIYNSLAVLCGEGDEVVIPAPCWVSYIEQVKLVGAKPVFAYTNRENGYIPRVEDIERMLTPQTKVLIINSPNNPTGAVYPRELLLELAELVKKHRLWLITDEVYENLVFEGTRHYSIVTLDPEMYDYTVTINAVSKTYSMTGWRVGYAAGPEKVIKALSGLQSHTTGNPNAMAQMAAAYAIKNNRDYREWVKEFDYRRKYVYEMLNQMPGIECNEPRGAFYIFPEASGLIGKSNGNISLKNSLDLAEYLLEEALVAVVPGEAFAADNHLRISYVNSRENLKKGMEQMMEAVGKLK